MSLFNGIEVLFYPFWTSGSMCFSINLPFHLYAWNEEQDGDFSGLPGCWLSWLSSAWCPGHGFIVLLYLILAGVRIFLVTGAPVCCSRWSFQPRFSISSVYGRLLLLWAASEDSSGVTRSLMGQAQVLNQSSESILIKHLKLLIYFKNIVLQGDPLFF